MGSTILLAAAASALLAAPAGAAPVLTMSAPTSGARTNGTPTFSGSTSDGLDKVKVLVYKGTSASGEPTQTLEAAPSGSSWSVKVPALEALTSGSYTALAEQSEFEILGGILGETEKTEPIGFTVDTSRPKVAITEGPEARSNQRKPSFEGTASEETEVTVHVLQGETEVAHSATTASGGTWTITLGEALPTGNNKFTAYATEKSAIGNPDGESSRVSFEVDTEPPAVTIVGPESLSNETTPSFSGKASENTEVTVHVFKNQAEVAHATTTASGGKWSTSTLSSPLPAGKNTFTAYATEVSGINNGPGKSSTVSFEVDTLAPTVTIVGPPTPSKNRSPTFTGEASEDGEVIVHILEGGKQIASAGGQVHAGAWSATPSTPLPAGTHTFTAYATEASGLGNGEGQSAEEVSFEVNTEPPTVTIVGPPSRSNKTVPGFSGGASEDTEVTVHVFEGATEVASATTTASGGKWSTSTLTNALPSGKHSFTAYATEVSGLGNPPGKSSTVSFEVDTEPPTVTIAQPPTPSRNTKPSFSGEASENTEVTVHVFEGLKQVATASTTASAGKWSISALSPALPTGKHTFSAYATEASGIGNLEGESNTVTFEVNTEPPSVAILKGPAARSNDTTPTFSGTASEDTEVVVHVFQGLTEVAKAKTTAASGTWEAVSSQLPKGDVQLRAYATEKSGISGNGEGVSNEVEFEVDTEPPTVTIVAPPSPSKSTTPSFSGEASEDTEVTVHVFEGSNQVGSATTTASGGKWSASLTKALPTGRHTFTAKAIETSGIGNGAGESKVVSFEINTESPHVTIEQPPTPSRNRNPSFSGEASEDTQVMVHVFEGPNQVATATTTASGGKWSTAGLSSELPAGKHTFTAYATETSGLGNLDGTSGTVEFEVNTEPPSVAILGGPAARSNQRTPSFSGTASESTEVVVHVFEGPVEVAHARTTAAGGTWSTSTLSQALPEGDNAFIAYATEKSGISGNLEGESNHVAFEVDTLPPTVTILAPPSPSKNTTPSFSGEASEETEVTVRVFEGNNQVASATTTASGGKWSTSSLTKALPNGRHTFTAKATEKSGIGNSPGESKAVSFEVNTESPHVTIEQPKTPSNNRNPSFGGEASEDTQVTVHVFEGPNQVASATTTASGGKWSISGVSPELPAGKHTFSAYATEVSGLENLEGTSNTVTFEVNTEPPSVAILKGPAARSNDTTPSFSGTASEDTKVVVHVFEGQIEVAKAETTASGGTWSAENLSKPLPQGNNTFSAYATEVSGLGNQPGKSGTLSFEVDTEPPAVTLVAPPSPSNNTTPTFSGTASENTEVVVHVFEGASEVGVAKTTASGGKWATAPLTQALSSGKHRFKAVASEKSGIGNGEGASNQVEFDVNTEPPVVTIAQPPTPSRNTTPSFSGEASEDSQVEVKVFEGKNEVATAVTTASGGHWSTPALTTPLPPGKRTFTAQASEKSLLGNAAGKSAIVTFEVNTEPPVVTIKQPTTPSKNTNPVFEGTASENTEVVVHVLEGATQIATGKATAAAGKWSASLSSALPSGKHLFTAYATEVSGLGNAEGQTAPVEFEVNTEPPVVTIKQPATPSNNTSPSFEGGASEATAVTVHVLDEGAKEVASATATASGGKWSTSGLSKALPSGKHVFSAFATEKSGIGNLDGRSASVTFEVNTEPPVVTFKQPTTPSNNTSPSFTGTASEASAVTVRVFEGSTEVASATTTASGGTWTTAPLTNPLPAGKHVFTAEAIEKSALGNADGHSSKVSFEVNTTAPVVTLNQPPTPTNNLNPAFAGSASEETLVTVHVREGTTEVATATTTASGGKWSTSALSQALPKGKHVFTAEATEKSALGNADGKSGTVTFEVNTEPPVVTVDAPAQVSNNTTPSFTGTASETEPVQVEVFKGEKAAGEPIEVLSASLSAGKWKTPSSGMLPSPSMYTVVAVQKSSIGNPAGRSTPVTFEVNTDAPTVTLEPESEPIKTPNNVTAPVFHGKVGNHGTTPVEVFVYEGSTVGGRIAWETKVNQLSGASWTAPAVSPVLPEGKHTFTVVARAPSSIKGNPEGTSKPFTFVVDTEPPEVTLDAPVPLSNQNKPSFSGTSSEGSTVTVSIYEGSGTSGREVASASAKPVGGLWRTEALSKSLEDGQYTAVARQPSAIGGNPAGESSASTFRVFTKPPTVTLNTLPTPSSNRAPSFSGAASESEPVIVEIHRGASDEGPLVATLPGAVVFEGEWFSQAVEPKLAFGEYTAVAREASSLGNPEGESAPFTFVVAQIPPAVATEGATGVTRTSAALYGAVNPLGGPITACNFEVGPSTAYGRSVGCGLVSEALSFPPAAVGFVPVFIRIYGLTPNTTYHYRVIAEGEGGTGVGPDMTFNTLPPLSAPPPETGSSPTPTGKSAVASFFSAQLKPAGKGAKIGALLRSAGYRLSFKAPGAGTARLKWYYVPPGAKLSAKAARKKPAPMLVATGTATFKAAGTTSLKLRLTGQGRHLLLHAKRIKLTATCAFTPAGEPAVIGSVTFLLTR